MFSYFITTDHCGMGLENPDDPVVPARFAPQVQGRILQRPLANQVRNRPAEQDGSGPWTGKLTTSFFNAVKNSLKTVICYKLIL